MAGAQANQSGKLTWPVAVLFCIAACFCIGFQIFTDWAIEDGLIVARIARNFARYGTLSYNPSQLVSSTTSPLFALVVGLIARLGADPLTAAQGLGVSATLAAGWLMLAPARSLVGPRYGWLVPALYLLLPTTVAYSVCGLETPVYTLACAGALFSSVAGRHRAALLWGALALVLRPDGIVALAVVLTVYGLQRGEWRAKAMGVLPAAAVLVCFYSVHFLFYDSFLPQSLLAKVQAYHNPIGVNVRHYLERMFLAQKAGLLLYALALPGLAVALRHSRRWWLPVLWYVAYHLLFMLRAPLFDWYLHPPVFVVAFFAGVAVAEGLRRLDERWGSRLTNALPACALALVVAGALVVTRQYAGGKLAYRAYEREVREAAGRWLAGHTAPGELVFTESLGYIGYQTPNPFVDWPGLVDPQVPSLVRGLGRWGGYLRIIEVKRPEYLALRDYGWDELAGPLAGHYRVVARFPSPFPSRQMPGYAIAQRRRGR